MSVPEILLIVSGPLIGGARVICYWLHIRFLRDVFARSGDRRDMTAAAMASLAAWRPRGSRSGRIIRSLGGVVSDSAPRPDGDGRRGSTRHGARGRTSEPLVRGRS